MPQLFAANFSAQIGKNGILGEYSKQGSRVMGIGRAEKRRDGHGKLQWGHGRSVVALGTSAGVLVRKPS